LNISEEMKNYFSGIALTNSTLVVTTVISKPYTMFKDSSSSQSGNDMFEGFCVDLIEELSKRLGFRYRFKLVSDGKYGAKDDNGEWNGMIGKVCEFFKTFYLF
jgi:hypothetical protein